jgi:hypothetical protein
VTTKIRATLAQLVWLACAFAALLLAVGALLIALDANKSNDLVDFVLRAADFVPRGLLAPGRHQAVPRAGRRGQERTVQLGPRSDRLAGRRAHPRPHHQALIRGAVARP